MTFKPSSAQKTSFHSALHRWYKTHGRKDLPWRNTKDPYAIYISEIMLQQTQVKTVLERYYTPFLNTFPTLTSLAQAKAQAVAKQWEGLGYYTRAANLHKAAQQCLGTLPDTPQTLHALPGIGRNTANAVACFGFGHAVPVMEANVRRVLCRVFAMRKADEEILWQKAQELLDTKNPFDYNQAMMDVGSLICTKRNPRCSMCPLNEICEGKASPELYPEPKAAKSTPVRKRIIMVLHDAQGGYYVYRRKSRFLHGLYGFPEYEHGAAGIEYGGRYYTHDTAKLIGQVIQVYSHFTLQAEVYSQKVAKQATKDAMLHRVTLEGMKELPFSKADHKVMALLLN